MADTGSYFARTCYASQDDAENAFFRDVGPVASSAASVSGFVDYAKQSDGWHWKHYTVSGSTMTLASDVVVDWLYFPPCDPAGTFIDGMTVGWGIAAALVFVACIKMMQRGAA